MTLKPLPGARHRGGRVAGFGILPDQKKSPAFAGLFLCLGPHAGEPSRMQGYDFFGGWLLYTKLSKLYSATRNQRYSSSRNLRHAS